MPVAPGDTGALHAVPTTLSQASARIDAAVVAARRAVDRAAAAPGPIAKLQRGRKGRRGGGEEDADEGGGGDGQGVGGGAAAATAGVDASGDGGSGGGGAPPRGLVPRASLPAPKPDRRLRFLAGRKRAVLPRGFRPRAAAGAAASPRVWLAVGVSEARERAVEAEARLEEAAEEAGEVEEEDEQEGGGAAAAAAAGAAGGGARRRRG